MNNGAGVSTNLNTPLTNVSTGTRVTTTGVVPTTVTNVPYGATSAYNTAYNTGTIATGQAGYAANAVPSGYGTNINPATNLASGSGYYGTGVAPVQQIKTQTTTTAPGGYVAT